VYVFNFTVERLSGCKKAARFIDRKPLGRFLSRLQRVCQCIEVPAVLVLGRDASDLHEYTRPVISPSNQSIIYFVVT